MGRADVEGFTRLCCAELRVLIVASFPVPKKRQKADTGCIRLFVFITIQPAISIQIRPRAQPVDCLLPGLNVPSYRMCAKDALSIYENTGTSNGRYATALEGCGGAHDARRASPRHPANIQQN